MFQALQDSCTSFVGIFWVGFQAFFQHMYGIPTPAQLIGFQLLDSSKFNIAAKFGEYSGEIQMNIANVCPMNLETQSVYRI